MNELRFIDKVSVLFLTFLIFSFLIDSGDPIGIRKLSLLLVMLVFVKYSTDFVYVRFSKFVVSSYIMICILSLYSVAWSSINGVEFLATLPWVVPLLFFPVFCYVFSQFKPEVVKISFISAGVCFSITVLVVFVCILIMGDVVKAFFYNLEFPGWFYLRGDGFPQVYFQSTLAFVVLSLYAFLNGYRKCSLLFLLSLMLSLSRFGSLVIILFVFSNYILGTRRLALFSFYALVSLSVIFIPLVLFIYLLLPPDVDYQMSADAVRFGHVLSVFNSMQPVHYIFGMGPGSFFYSNGFNALVDNIEVSQLELFRKYGILGYFLFNLAFILLSWCFLKSKRYSTQVCMSAFYFVAYSNPVLLTFMFSIFVAVFLSDKNIKTQINAV